MADGTIIIDTKIDQSGATVGVKKLQNKLDSATQAAKKQLQIVRDLELEYQKWADTVNDVKMAGGTVSPGLQDGMTATSAKLEDNKLKLEQLQIKAQEAGAALKEAMAPRIPQAFTNAAKSAHSQMSKFKSLLDRTILRAAVMVAVFKAIQKVQEYFNSALRVNQEYAKALSQLKAAFMTLAQPILQSVIPALVQMAQALAYVVTMLARFFSMLAGTSLSASQKSAESLYNQQKALDGVGGSAKKAEKALASFDEVNKIGNEDTSGGGGGSSVISPDFSALDAADSKMKDLLATIGAIAAGLLAWKIARSFGAGLEMAAGLAVALAGAVLLVTGYLDAWTNSVDWTNFAQILEGLTLLAVGLGLAFGPVAAAISLIAGGIALLVLGLKDLAENGMSLQNVLLIIAGLFTTGLGIGILTGSWIPVLIAAFLSIITAALAMTGNLDAFVELGKQMFQDFVGFFKALISGDWAGAWDYAGKIVDDLGEMLKLIWDSLKEAFNTLCDQIIEKVGGTNTAIGGLVEALKEIFNGIVEFVEGVFSGDWQKAWDGITGIFKGIVNGIAGLFSGMINAIIDGLNWLISKLNAISIPMPDWVEEKFGIGSIGFNIPEIDHISIPALATGAVIPPNKEFLAILGDQTNGTNIETPLSTMVQAFKQAMAESGGGRNITVILEMNKREFGRAVYQANSDETQRVGLVLA